MNRHASFMKLQTVLSKLPGVGRRSAERMAVKLLADDSKLLKELKTALMVVEENVCSCNLCGSITVTTQNPCNICVSPNRANKICVVEDPSDISSIEETAGYNGKYHALLGKISPMRGEGPQNLRIRQLIDRIHTENIDEVILALSMDMEGESTAAFLAELLQKHNVNVSRIAYGVPTGSGIRYADPLTIARSIEGRSKV
ncbi:MAG: recombination mediator RecR [Kiritimatiellae bacterium]|jgi:recombination protein RecR|nr:recombination mediator RecR [Kiritimatiellia bacterium]